MLVRDNLVVKLPRARVDALCAAGQGDRFDPCRDGRLTQAWLIVAPTSEADWLLLARETLALAASAR